MPGKLKVRILAARDLPVMDRASDSADAFVEVKFGQQTHKTEVCRKSLNPIWNSEWFKFEADDEELQDEPLHLRIMDYDTYSAHDAIGKVYIDLTPLLWKDGVTQIAGWMPIYDTMHGMRGEINIGVKVDLFEDVSRFRQSSVGVQFFNSGQVPSCYNLVAIHGFVEELVVNDDPEYQWIDMIRTPRASNEARQRLFSKLSGELQRKIGLKVLEMDGNAVIGYWQCYDLEGESGIVVRGIGTAASIQKSAPISSPLSASPPKDMHKEFHPFEDQGDSGSYSSPVSKQPTPQPPASPTKAVSPFRYSSDSDLPAGGSPGTAGSSGSGGGVSQKPTLTTKTAIMPQSIDMLEYPFFTITVLPPGFLIHLGGVVAARSVKLLDKIHNPDEPETRDVWWTEIRTEIRSHAAAMGCHAVVGYKETTSIYDEVILLSAMGTAAIVNMGAPLPPQPSSAGSGSGVLTVSLDRQEFQKEQQASGTPPTTEINLVDSAPIDSNPRCSMCHIPYNDTTLPFPVNLTKCHICKKQKVPDVIFCTIEPPPELQYTGKCCCISARICRAKRKAQGENNASLVSDALPFMEYELHRQLMNKLKLKGMNCLFGLRVQIIVGEILLVGTATATAAFVSALPPPSLLRVSGKSSGSTVVQSLQKKLQDITARNKDVYDLHHVELLDPGSQESPKALSTSTEELIDAQLTASQKDTYVLEIDDAEDSATVAGLFDPELPEGFYNCSTEVVPGNLCPTKHLQMITMMRMQTVTEPMTKHFSPIFDDLVQGMCFKLRSMSPCCLCKLCFDVMLPEDDIIQVYLTAAAVQVKETTQDITAQKGTRSSADAEMMFAMEELTDPSQQAPKHSTPSKGQKPVHLEKRIILPPSHENINWRPSVEITPLCTIPDGVIDRYLGNINIFFIRETTSVRESGGVSGFMHGFVSEVNAIIRSHVTALGGNALVAYTLIDCILMDNPHKNQCQCLVNVCGDAVHVLYDGALSSDTSSPSHLSPRSAQPSPRETGTTASEVHGGST